MKSTNRVQWRKHDLPYESDEDLTDAMIAVGLMEITALSLADVLEGEPFYDSDSANISNGFDQRWRVQNPRMKTNLLKGNPPDKL